MQFCDLSQWAFELETLQNPLDIKTPIKMLLSHGSGPTDMISVQQTQTKNFGVFFTFLYCFGWLKSISPGVGLF